MRVLSLFSGGGLGDYGLELAGMEIVGQVEIDDYCQKILNLRWPEVPKWGDIGGVKGAEVIEKVGQIDLISGGFPCQPFSVAGKRRGKQDDRYLWPEMFRVISEIKPTWVLGENVPGIIKFALDQVLSDLESIGYACQAFVIPACAKDAPHRRSRVWIIAYSRLFGQKEHEIKATRTKQLCENVADSKSQRQPRRCLQVSPWYSSKTKQKRYQGRSEIIQHFRQWEIEPNVGRVAHGIANRVDRLKLLGNGQVVPLVRWIGERIMEFERIK